MPPASFRHSQRLLHRGDRVIGIDNLNNYYDPALKQARLEAIEAMAPAGAWQFEQIALEDGEALLALRRAAPGGGEPGGPGGCALFP